MKTILILNAQVVNEGKIQTQDIFVKNGLIDKIGNDLSGLPADKIINAAGKYLFPGVIDDQVHFREPGLTHKACIHSEARAGVAGGVTTFMEMPNTVPNALTQELLADKYEIAARTSLANYSFYMGVSNDNLEEALKTDAQNVCGLKIFMGSSTGNMLVDNEETLENIFSKSPLLIATHCEVEEIVRANAESYRQKFGDNPHPRVHPEIRSVEACYNSSSMAIELAKKHNARLHILHITTGEETELFRNDIPLKEKRITAEVCVHHLYFDARDYETLGNQIKCNPAVKADGHKQRILQGLLDDRIDVIATDHAPHTWEEKQNPYWSSPSGLPLVQHPLNLMLDFYHEGKISLEKIAEKMAHAVADCFQISKRGYIREGYWADLVLVDLNDNTTVTKDNIYYQCGWSPLEGKTFQSKITHTLVSGHLAFEEGNFDESEQGKRLLFER
ncbi:MAG: dihydroorotase [Arcicella sp.]|jgi:dihydroorotase|nr:dihydroorotase [Arcicella sp.]